MDATELPTLRPECFGLVHFSAGFKERFGNIARALANELFWRFAKNDWGSLCEEDKGYNARDLLSGVPCRLMGVYDVGPQKEKVWVISYIQYDFEMQQNHDRCNTCVLLPSDY